ncbi:uncharacterized protein LOC113205519 [Frankliniella occidentalis]|uniref:Uncharacterized protein LOC113205519 n=1 Tax=Frankliniella occidentalis TaxID=133901 RepID=A0A9C6XBV4_FRAOC|nr:uncharacterized protein LOC113205519 [Frankliniella occidentalis]
MFTTETDLAAPAEDRPESPPPPPEPEVESLPRVEGAALKCGRHPRRGPNPPARPYARAQFAVVAADPESPPDSPQHHAPSPGPALANAYSSFQVAKQLHKENLEHNPLPDTVDDNLFKKLNSQRHPNPGIALDVVPDAAAVGWRSFNAPGPTNCSKMKVYRPKTAAPIGARNGLEMTGRLQRPSTGHPSKLLAKDHVSEMELAICWDLVPAYPEDEPKPTPHIDGSNGSKAPGIFSLVHHPADNEGDADDVRPSARTSNGPRRTSTPPAAKDRKAPPQPPSVESVHSCSSSQQKAARTGAPDHELHERLHAQERQRAAVQRRYNGGRVPAHPAPADVARDLCDFRKRNGCYAGMQGCGDGTTRDDPRNLNDHLAELRKHRHFHQSMPDLSGHGGQQRRGAGHQGHPHGHQQRSASHHRGQQRGNPRPPCAACARPTSPPPLRRPKSEYKMAFKAGKPTTSLSTNSSFDTPPSVHSGAGCGVGCSLGREVRVPKQRAPFARKNYAITSLTQPFSLWPKETGHAYPEHWRLASVYQHSFKPVHARSKPLLKTVYQ